MWTVTNTDPGSEQQNDCGKSTHEDQDPWETGVWCQAFYCPSSGTPLLPQRRSASGAPAALGATAGKVTSTDVEKIANPDAPGIPLTTTPDNLYFSSTGSCTPIQYQPVDRGKVMEPRALRALTWNLELPPGTTLAEDLEKLSLSLERGWEDPKGASSSLHSTAQPEIIINLAEEVLVQNQSGRSYNAIAVHDPCSDSSWVSKELAESFLPKWKRRKVSVPVQTIQATTSIQTWEYEIQIQVGNTLKTIMVYESPSLGSIQYDDRLYLFLQETFKHDIHLPEGDVGLLIGLKHHTISPDSLLRHKTLNLKLYESSIVPSRKLPCGSVLNSIIRGSTGLV